MYILRLYWKVLLLVVVVPLSNMGASDYIDSLRQNLNQIDSTINPKDWIEAYVVLAETLEDNAQFDEALKGFNAILDFSKKRQLDTDILHLEVSIASIIHRKGNYELSLEQLVKIRPKIKQDDLDLKGRVLRMIGINHVLLGNYSTGYEVQKEALEIYKQLKDTTFIARTYFGLGNNFFYQNQFDKSLFYFNEVLEVCEKINLKQGIFQAYGAISSVYEEQKNYEKALENSLLAVKIAKELNDEEGVAWTQLTLGFIQSKMGNHKIALSTLKQSLELAIQMGDVPLEGYIYEGIATVYNNMGNYHRAIFYLQKSYVITRGNNERSNVVKLYKLFSDIYYQKRDLKNYKKYTDKYIALSDSLFNEKMIKEMSNLEERYEVQQLEKENEIALLKKDKELGRLRSWMAIAGVIILFLIAYVLYARFKAQRERNKILQQKNKEITRQNEILEAVNQDLEQYAHIVAHDLKEPLRSISSFTTLLKRSLRYQINDTAKEYMRFIVNSTNQMDNLLIDLLQYSKISIQDKTFEEVDVNILISEVIASMQLEIERQKGCITILQPLPSVQINRALLWEVFKNLFSNALKFRCENAPIVQVDYQENNSECIFSVADNGIGIEEEYYEQIFVVFKRLHDRSKYTGSGIGLAMCKKIIEERGGRIWVTSKVGEGSIFYFTIPKQTTNAEEVL